MRPQAHPVPDLYTPMMHQALQRRLAAEGLAQAHHVPCFPSRCDTNIAAQTVRGRPVPSSSCAWLVCPRYASGTAVQSASGRPGGLATEQRATLGSRSMSNSASS